MVWLLSVIWLYRGFFLVVNVSAGDVVVQEETAVILEGLFEVRGRGSFSPGRATLHAGAVSSHGPEFPRFPFLF